MIAIRTVTPDDREAWEVLYRGYAAFYKVETSTTKLGNLWGWIHDPGYPVEGLVCEVDGSLVGLAHFRAMPSPLRGAEIGFLDDLFVDPQLRGSGAAAALIAAVGDVARERGWDVVRWITADDNYRARSLYDKLSTKTGWNTYELKP